jgi:uncharacterized protein YkwD
LKTQRKHPLHRGLLGVLLSAALLGGCGVDAGLWGIADQGSRVPIRPPDTSSSSSNSTISDSTSNGTTAFPLCAGATEPVGAEQIAMFDAINAYRVANGLNALTYSARLENAASGFAEQMWREDFFDHTAPDGTTPADRAEAAGFCNRFVGENIAYGLNTLSTAQAAMNGFENSPPHNENLLNPNWDFVGVGYLRVPGLQGSEYWWVQLFAANLDN